MNNFKKVLATLCSATLILSSSVTAFATSGTTPESTEGGNGYLVAYSVETVTVPTAVKVSFNPQGWDFTIRGTGSSAVTSDDQIVSLNYGIASDATLDKKITVSFNAVATNGDGTNDVVFVDSAAKAQAKSTTNTEGAAPGEYKMYLAVAPSDAVVDKGYAADGTATDFKVDDTSKKTTVTTTLLGDVDMTPAEVGVQVFKDNKAEISYKLDAAEYVLKQDAVLDFTTTQADIASKFDTSAIGSVVGFTFVGAMNPDVDWTKAKITALEITPTYEVEDVDGTETTITGAYNVIGEAAASGGSGSSATITMTPNSTGDYRATISAASGTLTKIVVDGTDRTSQIGTNITWNDTSKVLKIAKAQSTNWNLASGKTVVATINGTDYTITTSAN